MKRKSRVKTFAFAMLGIVGAFILLIFIVSGEYMKPIYLEPWEKSYSVKYSDPRVRLTAVGLLAASGHNMQPWKVRLDKTDPMAFYLYADGSRMTKEVDPYARQMMISEGTFLEYIAVAGEKEGWNAEIHLFPDGVYDEKNLARSMDAVPVAKITLSKVRPQDTALYDAAFLPDTNREAYQAEKLSSRQVSALKSLSSAIKLYQDPTHLNKIGGYAVRSAEIEAGVDRVMEESTAVFRANEFQKNRYRYGFSVEGQGTSGVMKPVLQGLLTLFPALNRGGAASRNFVDSTRTSVEHTPAYAMIVTPDNSRASQVKSGMLYSRLVLTGHTLGLAMQPLSQVLEEYPEMKVPYAEFQRAYAPGGGTVQMLFRIGRPTKNVPVSMRRDGMDLIVKD